MEPHPDTWPKNMVRQGCYATRAQMHYAWLAWADSREHTVARMVSCLRMAGCDVPKWVSYGWYLFAETLLNHAAGKGLCRHDGHDWEIL